MSSRNNRKLNSDQQVPGQILCRCPPLAIVRVCLEYHNNSYYQMQILSPSFHFLREEFVFPWQSPPVFLVGCSHLHFLPQTAINAGEEYGQVNTHQTGEFSLHLHNQTPIAAVRKFCWQNDLISNFFNAFVEYRFVFHVGIIAHIGKCRNFLRLFKTTKQVK